MIPPFLCQSSFLSFLTILQFLFLVVYLPYVKGVVPNCEFIFSFLPHLLADPPFVPADSRWRSSPPLTTIVPLLTVTILGGFVLLVFGLKTISASYPGGGSGLLGAVGGGELAFVRRVLSNAPRTNSPLCLCSCQPSVPMRRCLAPLVSSLLPSLLAPFELTEREAALEASRPSFLSDVASWDA